MIDVNKFDDLEDLPISEEMLGAYLEGNLHGSEFREVHSYIQEDPLTSTLIDAITDDYGEVGNLGLIGSSEFGFMGGNEDVFDSFSLPEIQPFGSEPLIDPSSPLTEDIVIGGDCHNIIDSDVHTSYSENTINDHHSPELDSGIMDNNI